MDSLWVNCCEFLDRAPAAGGQAFDADLGAGRPVEVQGDTENFAPPDRIPIGV